MPNQYDAVVVGSGPNGLAAAIVLARAGRSVLVREAKATLGGGARTAELTLPGFRHDTCSAIHPLAVASPFFVTLPLEAHGLKWIDPPVALAHPLDGGRAACLYRSLDETAKRLGADDRGYRRLMEPGLRHWPELLDELMAPLHFPRHPWRLMRFGLRAGRSARGLASAFFRTEEAKALLGGLAAHSFLPLTQMPSAAIGVVLGLAGHAAGWPFPEGGAGRLSEALVSYFRSLGGEIATEAPVNRIEDLPPSRVVLFDLMPRRLAELAGDRLSASYRRRLEKFRPGPGCFKIDWALSGPVPWQSPEVARAGTIHLGGTLEELMESESAPWKTRVCERPFVLAAQPSRFDPTRAPEGKQTFWGYCHVPLGSTVDMTERIEAQVERFAPGFRDLILEKKVSFPSDLEAQNPNLVGGDISGGIADLRQAFFRPMMKANPYATSRSDWFLCSAATPPGAGVHGMCGFHAGMAALRALS